MSFITGKLIILKNNTPIFNIIDYSPVVEPELFISYSLTLGDNANYVGIWADPLAGLHSGKFHLSTQDSLFIIDLKDKVLYDRYTQTIKGRANEFLEQDNIIDFTVGN